MFNKTTRRFALALAACATLSTLATAQTAPADVFVIHGIRGEDLNLPAELPVDITVDGGCVLAGFEFGEVAGPLQLPAGTYQIEVRLAEAGAPCTGPVVISAAVSFAAGENATVIAHLDENGGLTASKFVNDVSSSAAGSRLQLHHTAAAPAVDIRVPGMTLMNRNFALFLPGVTNGQQGGADVAPGSYRAAVALAGTNTIVLGPLGGRIKEGRLLSGYVVGSAANGTLTVLSASQLLQ